MDRITNTRCNDLCIQIGYCKNIRNLTDEINTSLADVIQTSQERRYISSASACCKQCLVCAEDQCHIGLDSLGGKNLTSLQSFHCHRDLYYHIGMDLCNLTAFLNHAFCIGSSSLYLTADRSVYDGSDLCDNLLKYSAFLCDQGRVCGNATDYAHVVCLLNVLNLSGVNEKTHSSNLLFVFF